MKREERWYEPLQLHRLRSSALYLALLVLLGTILRVHLLIGSDFVIDADEAIVGLMARHIAAGEALPVFYYGQHYMGSLEALLAALSFRLFGESNWSLQLVPLLFGLLLIPAVFLLGVLVRDERCGRYAATLIAIPPQALLVWSVKARGGFIELVFIGTLALVAALGWYRSASRPVILLFLMGALVGVGWWVNNQIVFFIPGLLLLFFVTVWGDAGYSLGERVKRFLLQSTVGTSGFLIGSAPFWIYNLTSDPRFATFRFLIQPAEGGRSIEHFWGFVTVSLPILFGARGFWQEQDLFPGASILVWSLASVVLVGSLGLTISERRRGPLLSLRPLELLLVCGATTILVFSTSAFGWLSQAPRYLLPLYPIAFTLVALLATRCGAGIRRGALGLLLGVHLFSVYPLEQAIPGEPFVFGGDRVSRDHSELYQWLEERNISWIRTNYWIGYRVAFETGERVRFRIFQAPYQERIEAYVRASPPRESMPLVLVPREAQIVEPALTALGWEFERVERSGYVILHNLVRVSFPEAVVPCDEVRVISNINEGGAQAASDCSVSNRWGSASPQRPGMELVAQLEQPRTLRGFEYDFGSFRHDYPRGLEVVIRRPDGSERVLIPESVWPGIRYYLEERSVISVAFHPELVERIIFRQMGSDAVFDWSVAELRFLW